VKKSISHESGDEGEHLNSSKDVTTQPH